MPLPNTTLLNSLTLLSPTSPSLSLGGTIEWIMDFVIVVSSSWLQDAEENRSPEILDWEHQKETKEKQ
jgi:hypothetical protein